MVCGPTFGLGVALKPGGGADWDAVMHERLATARKLRGWIGGQLLGPEDGDDRRVIVGTWDTRADWESWHHDPQFEDRLPFQSPVLGGVALAVLVALPLSALAGLAWVGDPRTADAATAVGVVLIGWIVVQLLFLRELSFFHPLYVAVGAGLAVWGRRIGPSPDRIR